MVYIGVFMLCACSVRRMYEQKYMKMSVDLQGIYWNINFVFQANWWREVVTRRGRNISWNKRAIWLSHLWLLPRHSLDQSSTTRVKLSNFVWNVHADVKRLHCYNCHHTDIRVCNTNAASCISQWKKFKFWFKFRFVIWAIDTDFYRFYDTHSIGSIERIVGFFG